MLCLPRGVVKPGWGDCSICAPGWEMRGLLCLVVRGLKIPSKAGAARQAPAPGERYNPRKGQTQRDRGASADPPDEKEEVVASERRSSGFASPASKVALPT